MPVNICNNNNNNECLGKTKMYTERQRSGQFEKRNTRCDETSQNRTRQPAQQEMNTKGRNDSKGGRERERERTQLYSTV